VLQGLYNDAIPNLASPDNATNCTFAGQPIELCGSHSGPEILNVRNVFAVRVSDLPVRLFGRMSFLRMLAGV
jgi:hypothetical protein